MVHQSLTYPNVVSDELFNETNKLFAFLTKMISPDGCNENLSSEIYVVNYGKLVLRLGETPKR